MSTTRRDRVIANRTAAADELLGERRRRTAEPVVVFAMVEARTDKAVLLRLRGERAAVWCPLTAIVSVDELPRVDDSGPVAIAAWLAKREGIEPEPDAETATAGHAPKPKGPPKIARSAAFGEGRVVEERGDRVVVDFGPPHGRRTVLRDRLVIR